MVYYGNLIIENGEFESNNYVFKIQGNDEGNGSVIINKGEFTAQEACIASLKNSSVTVNGGEFTSKNNFVIMTNGTPNYENNKIVVNNGIFNGFIQNEGYIAGGIYLANDDVLEVNGGTFNIYEGVGMVIRAGKATINNCTINLNNSGNIANGRVGDSNINLTTASKIIVDRRSDYPADATLDVTAKGFNLVDGEGKPVDRYGYPISESK